MSFLNKFKRHENVPCGLMHILPADEPYSKEQRILPIPLKSVDVNACIFSTFAQVEVTQVYFHNVGALEAIFNFPLDSRGAVTHFQAKFGDRTITAVIKPNQEETTSHTAIHTQESGINRGWSFKNPDVFSIKLGALKNNSMVKIVFKYVTELKFENGFIFFSVPNIVAPYYISAHDGTPQDLKEIKFSTDYRCVPQSLTIRVKVNIQGAIKKLQSTSHDTQIVLGQTRENLTWTTGVVEFIGKIQDLDRDFQVLVEPEDANIAIQISEAFEETTAVLVNLIPKFQIDEQKVEIIFIIDRSASMMGMNMKLVRKAILMGLRSAPEDCYLNIVGFGRSFKFLFPVSVKYDDDSLEVAIQHVSTLEADLGGTKIYSALKAVYEMEKIPSYRRQIFLLTDGEIYNEEQILGLVKAHAHSTRLFVLGIGDDCSDAFEAIAEVGGGSANFVKYREDIAPKLLMQLKICMEPSLLDLQVEWTGFHREMQVHSVRNRREDSSCHDGKSLEASAEPLKNRFGKATRKFLQNDVSKLLVYGLFSGEVPSALVMNSQALDGAGSLEVKLNETNDLNFGGMVLKLAAINKIRELDLQVAALDYFNNGEDKSRQKILKEEILELSVKYGVYSKYSSLVAVTSNGEEENKSWVMPKPHLVSEVADTCNTSSELVLNIEDWTETWTVDEDDCWESDESEPEAINMTPESRNSPDKLEVLVSTQSYNGCFKLNEDFAAAVECKLVDLQRESRSRGCDINTFATTLAIAFMEGEMENLRGVWHLIALKGKKWLENSISENMSKIINEMWLNLGKPPSQIENLDNESHIKNELSRPDSEPLRGTPIKIKNDPGSPLLHLMGSQFFQKKGYKSS